MKKGKNVNKLIRKKGFKYLNQYLVSEGNTKVYRTLLENTNYKRE